MRLWILMSMIIYHEHIKTNYGGIKILGPKPLTKLQNNQQTIKSVFRRSGLFKYLIDKVARLVIQPKLNTLFAYYLYLVVYFYSLTFKKTNLIPYFLKQGHICSLRLFPTNIVYFCMCGLSVGILSSPSSFFLSFFIHLFIYEPQINLGHKPSQLSSLQVKSIKSIIESKERISYKRCSSIEILKSFGSFDLKVYSNSNMLWRPICHYGDNVVLYMATKVRNYRKQFQGCPHFKVSIHIHP